MNSSKKYTKAINNRNELLKLLEPFFTDTTEAGVYISKKLSAEMVVAGNQITLNFSTSAASKDGIWA